jgi:hypothetical protein
MSTPFDLTFGIELEFMAICKGDLDVGEGIYKRLLEAGIPATGWEPLDDDINDDASFPSYSRWRVADDYVDLSRDEKALLPPDWKVETVELASRKFRFFSNWQDGIAKVLEIIRRMEHPGLRFITNYTTGFHVHVGFDSFVVPLRTAKNVFQLLTAFERQVDEIHLPERTKIPEKIDSAHNYFPPSFFHMADPEADGETLLRDVPLVERLADIEAVQSYKDLGVMFEVDFPAENCHTSGHNSSINFDNLYTDSESNRHTLTGTIEFRQHSGTLDLSTVKAWILLTCTIVQYAGSAPIDEFLHLLLQSVEKGLTFSQLLGAIRCPIEVREFYSAAPEVLGFAPAGDVRKLMSAPEVEKLIELNDETYQERSNPEVTKAAIWVKMLKSQYGISANSDLMSPPLDMVRNELEHRVAQLPVITETGLSQVREELFRDFGGFDFGGLLI